jgi:mono/diheme cytochrome c family protein
MIKHDKIHALIACLTALLLFAAVARRTSASPRGQDDGTPQVSTMAGVFTTAQASRGEETYMTICVGCHPAGTYTGKTFIVSWGNRALSDLFSIIKNTMPKVDPGMLSPEETSQVIAYILKSNGVPAGKTELPSELAPLKNIRIEMPGMAAPKIEHENQSIR